MRNGTGLKSLLRYKALFPIDVTFSGIKQYTILLHSFNTPSSTINILGGNSKCVRFLQKLNAEFLIVVTLCGILISVK